MVTAYSCSAKRDMYQQWGCSIAGLMRLPVTQETVGSNPINPAKK